MEGKSQGRIDLIGAIQKLRDNIRDVKGETGMILAKPVASDFQVLEHSKDLLN